MPCQLVIPSPSPRAAQRSSFRPFELYKVLRTVQITRTVHTVTHGVKSSVRNEAVHKPFWWFFWRPESCLWSPDFFGGNFEVRTQQDDGDILLHTVLYVPEPGVSSSNNAISSRFQCRLGLLALFEGIRSYQDRTETSLARYFLVETFYFYHLATSGLAQWDRAKTAFTRTWTWPGLYCTWKYNYLYMVRVWHF